MSMTRHATSPSSTHLGLHLALRCRDWILALEASRVDYILPFDEALLVESEEDEESGGFGHIGRIFLAERELEAFDLGVILGIDQEPQAWVTIRSSRPGSDFVLRVGRCLVVSDLELSSLSGIPKGVSTQWPGIYRGMFHRRSLVGDAGVRDDAYGLILNMDSLCAGIQARLETMKESGSIHHT